MPSRPTVVLYGRPDCHLCDEARAGLESLRADGLAFDLDHRDPLEEAPQELLVGIDVDLLQLKREAAGSK